MATGRKKDRQSDAIRSSDSQMSGNSISNLKRHIYRKCEQVASYNKQKDELKTGEALIHVDYSQS